MKDIKKLILSLFIGALFSLLVMLFANNITNNVDWISYIISIVSVTLGSVAALKLSKK